jgi:hypothetical protein
MYILQDSGPAAGIAYKIACKMGGTPVRAHLRSRKNSIESMR